MQVKLGYINALKSLKLFASKFDNDANRAEYKHLQDIINDFEFCVNKAEKCSKYEEALMLLKEAEEL